MSQPFYFVLANASHRPLKSKSASLKSHNSSPGIVQPLAQLQVPLLLDL